MTRIGVMFPGSRYLGGLQAFYTYLPLMVGSPLPLIVYDQQLGRPGGVRGLRQLRLLQGLRNATVSCKLHTQR